MFRYFFQCRNTLSAILADTGVFLAASNVSKWHNAPFQAKINNQKCVIFDLKIHQNWFAAGAGGTPTGGAYSTPPDPVPGFHGSLHGTGREKEQGREGEKVGGGKLLPTMITI